MAILLNNFHFCGNSLIIRPHIPNRIKRTNSRNYLAGEQYHLPCYRLRAFSVAASTIWNACQISLEIVRNFWYLQLLAQKPFCYLSMSVTIPQKPIGELFKNEIKIKDLPAIKIRVKPEPPGTDDLTGLAELFDPSKSSEVAQAKTVK